MSQLRSPDQSWARRVPAGPGADATVLAEQLRSRRWLVLTGAGMSTASGIPDYRGPDGTRRVQPMTIQELRSSSAARQRYWARSYVGWQRLHRARPNAAHRAVTELQRLGVVDRVITQNVDGLHQRAGTRQVIELHGSLARVVCDHCGDGLPRPELDAMMRAANPSYTVTSDEIRPDGDVALDEVDVTRFVTPRCPGCNHDRLRPDVVFFGDSVPRERVETCTALVAACEGLVVLGSSLAVMSGLRFVRQAARRGVPVMIITAGPTRADELAAVRSHRPVEQVLPQLLAHVTA
ncbi:NAD-dependent protein deacetylase [Propionibacteriaceae bacterium Y2011]